MAATPKGPQKATLNQIVDRQTYDAFMKMCSNKGYAPNIVLEKAMKRFTETGQI